MSFYIEQYERAVLGEMMMRQKFFEEVFEEDFDNARHRDLFSEIKRRHEEKLPFTIIDLKDVGFKIFGNQEHATMATDAQEYFIPSVTIGELKKATRRRSMDRVIRGAGEALRGDEDVDTIVDGLEQGLLDIAGGSPDAEFHPVSDSIGGVVSAIEEIYNRRGGLSGIPSGFVGLDLMTDGFQGSDYIIVAARPSVGKTAIANQFIMTACRQGKTVGFFSAEMPEGKILQRMVHSISGVSLQDIRTGALSPAQHHDLHKAFEEVHGFRLYIDDTPNIDVAKLSIKAKRLRREKKIDMLVVDYLGLIDSMGSEKKSIYEKVTGISRKMKQLARELRIPVVVLAQINRDAEGREPTLANLRDSGAIEQDADLIMMLHRRGESRNSALDLIVAKHRNGPTGRLGVSFDQETQWFTEFKEPG